MRNITVAAIQMQCSTVVEENLKKAEEMVRKAAGKGAQVILLPELFEREYFCQQKRYDFYEYALPVDENPAVQMGKRLARELDVVLPISFYERDGNVLYNSLAWIDADGELLGVYRKTHIPDDHFYQEKFYFTPGNTGFMVFDTKYGRLGAGICWDQWFPETARALALKGAEVIYSDIAETHVSGHACCEELKLMHSLIRPKYFMPVHGEASSFIADETGELVQSASRDKEEILVQTFDLDQVRENRLSWGIFRDRRPEMYEDIVF